MTEENTTTTPEKPKNRHERRMNNSKKARNKAKKFILKKIQGLDFSNIGGSIVVDGIALTKEDFTK